MRPIQIWLPTLPSPIGDKVVELDAKRAFRQWRGQATVWLLPGLEEPKEWIEGDEHFRVLAIPADRLNRLDVFHVGENGYVCGPQALALFPDSRVDGLLGAWLNVVRRRGVKLIPVDERALTLPIPIITADGVRYELAEVELEPGPVLPVSVGASLAFQQTAAPPSEPEAVAADADQQRVYEALGWPIAGVTRPTVDPRAESVEYYGQLSRVLRDGNPTVVSAKHPEVRAREAVFRLASPLDRFFPYGHTGMDDLYAEAYMAHIAEVSGDDPARALRMARDATMLYLSEGESWPGLHWLFQTILEKGINDVLFEAESRFDVHATTLQEALEDPAFDEYLSQPGPRPIRRAWGAAGLFWALLLEQLEEEHTFRVCQRCGRLIGGKADKRYCHLDDDAACFRARRAKDSRKARRRLRES